MPQLTEEQKSYIVEHINDRPRTAVAKAAGVSNSTLYKVVRMYGGERKYSLSKRNPEYVELVKKYYPTMSGREMQAKFGISFSRADTIARDLGIKHTEETLLRLKAKINSNLEYGRLYSDRAKAARKRAITRRMEEYRVWEGKPQKTKLRLRRYPRKTYQAIWQLTKKRGYIETTDAYTLMYDRNTHRMNEQYYAGKYKLRFIEDESNDILEHKG